MKGIVMEEPYVFEKDPQFLSFKLRLPLVKRARNYIYVLVRQDYDYIPKLKEVIEISGNLLNYDLGTQDGVRLFLKAVIIMPCQDEPNSIKDNTIKVTGTIRAIEPVVTKKSGKLIGRFSIHSNSAEINKIPIYCVVEGEAASMLTKYKSGDAITINGSLVTRNFTRNEFERYTTELYVRDLNVQTKEE